MAYKHVIIAKRKNLFNKNNATIINGYIYSGQLIITESPVDRTIVFPCKPNTTYTFSKMYTNRLFMAETSEETPAIGTTCTHPIANLGEPPSQNYCTLTTTATAKNLVITVCALSNTETYTLQEILDSVQIEEGSTPTPYTPYNYLQSNKRMIKVSDVCQLYAKNIWQEYTDLYGVSIKNNNDGSITLNGTATETFFYTNILDYEIKPNHVYFYFDAYNEEPSWSTYVGGCEGKIIDAGGASGANYAIYNLKREGTIAKARPDLPKNLLNTFCMCYKGFTLNNVTIKPQLFDLTEMFGAGHEPATVAEFRQRFPNELYPYSPQCWLTSYKSAVVCKTKNLFDINSAVKVSGASFFSKNGNQITVSTNGTYHYISANVLLDTSLVGKTVTFSAYAKTSDKNTAYLRIQWMTPNGLASTSLIESNNVSGQAYQKVSLTGVVPVQPDDEHNMLCLSFYSDGPNTTTLPSQLYTVVYTDIQVEQGSTATSYVPYQHL